MLSAELKLLIKQERVWHKRLLMPICIVHPNNFGKNARTIYPDEWQDISKYIRMTKNNTCIYCQHRHNLHCHEEWRYDDENKIQYLHSLQCVCYLCHMAIHPGANSYFDIFEEYQIINHFRFVNKLSTMQYDRYITVVENISKLRATHEYQLDIESIDNMIKPILDKLDVDIIL